MIPIPTISYFNIFVLQHLHNITQFTHLHRYYFSRTTNTITSYQPPVTILFIHISRLYLATFYTAPYFHLTHLHYTHQGYKIVGLRNFNIPDAIDPPAPYLTTITDPTRLPAYLVEHLSPNLFKLYNEARATNKTLDATIFTQLLALTFLCP